MKTFPVEWTKESNVFTAAVADNSVMLQAKVGSEVEFDTFVRGVVNRDDIAAFPRRDPHGRYDSIEILSTRSLLVM